ncbi:E3 ubiquitin/ISG15 ligase TRIM25-like isoform X1 [Clarias gariepinus]|uniref:E3 ubiquitin/ISG15 ligase TRIM25-like isoform X1 n=1 Tax=Clarias gariepinus TaxID=13013 RepID=UPI00234C0B19|nr:E3 ubiquitin/ISG15 ligase TRIM25-like isoform X1 [Clarias gariepinus]
MKMAEASIFVDEDQFICPICLDLLDDPVTIHCGHCYCNVCINDCWDQEDKSGVYSCPQCRDTFTPRPVLRRNNMLAEVVEKLKDKKEKKKKKRKKRKKKTEVQAASPAHCYAGPGDVECDFCTGRKHKAVKSCLMCLASFCETHLKPHLEIPPLKKHELVEASENLEEKICSEHDNVLEIYCRTDRSFICHWCMMDEHKNHDTVSVKAYSTAKKSELKEEQMKSQQRIQEKQKKVQELKQAVNTIKLSAQTAVEDSEMIFVELISSMEKKRSEVTELIRAQEKTELSRAERLLEQLEQEIADLQRRLTELEQLSHIHDHIQFLQSLQSLSVSPAWEDLPIITVNQHLSFDRMRKSLSHLKNRLEEFFQEELIKIPQHGSWQAQNVPPVGNMRRLPETSQETKMIMMKEQGQGQTAVEDIGTIFTELINSMEKKRSEVTELIRAQEEKTELSRAERLLEQLEQEIADLQRRLPELEQLSHTHDHIQFLQSLQSLSVSSGREDSPSITVNQRLPVGGLRKSLSHPKNVLEEFFQEELIKIPRHVEDIHHLLSGPKNREEFLKYSCDLTLDPNTVNYYLKLSKKNRVVKCSEIEQPYPDHPERFDYFYQVLSKESVCGRCYWEVKWSSERSVYISVSYKDISRKCDGDECVFGCNHQSWSLQCFSSSLSFYHNKIETDLRAPSSSRIGVYVDHSAGTLSFYSVSDTMKLLHRVHTTFTQPLYAGFGLDWDVYCESGATVKLCNLKY